MKKITLTALCMAASMAQVANAGALPTTMPDAVTALSLAQLVETSGKVERAFECPEGTGLTEAGHCQPFWEFD